MMLLPPPPDGCPICAVKHPDVAPHHGNSLYYQYRFYGTHGRWPTWADAIAHCTPKVQSLWKEQLQMRHAWTEPENGEPIADPPAESFRQAVGDINSRTFGPEEDK
jgi:hypothetical protein